MSFPAYSSYQHSGVEWLGEVPSHWVVERVKHNSYLKGRVGWKGLTSDEYLDDGFAYLVTGTDFRGRTISWAECYCVDRERYEDDPFIQLVDGDLLITKDGTIGKLTLVSGLDKPACLNSGIFLVRPTRAYRTEFLYWVLGSKAFSRFCDLLSTGSTIQHLYQNVFENFAFPIPSEPEQAAIVAFLDREIAKIDTLIEEQRRLIVLLKEKRQAVIAHAVTKGLDPRAPMKDSGIEWLGEIPAHWEVGALKRHWSVTDCKHITAEFVDDGIPLASIREVQSQFVDLSVAKRTTEQFFDQLIEGGRKPEPGDLIFSRNATVGEVAQVAEWHPPFAMGQDVCLLKRRQADVCSDFMQLLLRSLVGETQLANLMIGSTFKRVNVEEIRNLVLPFPPVLEQRDIALSLLRHANAFADLSDEAERGIALLIERRAALISAAVTGKIDVRGSATVLPFPVDRARARGLVAAEVIERSACQPTFGRVKFQKIAFLAEGHVGISELAGSYTREAAGPLDRALIDEMESGAGRIAGITVDQAGGTGTAVSYRLGQHRGAHSQELADWLGADRTAKLDKLIADFAPLTTKQAEAIATLYGVWNDALSEGATPTDDEIIAGFLNDWHPEKRAKFRASELPEWLGWMRRHGIVPTGSGPKTSTGRLFV